MAGWRLSKAGAAGALMCGLLLPVAPASVGEVNTINISTSTHEVTDVPAAQISDGLSAVDMRQLEKAADLTGTPLEELIRSAWDDNFSLLISELRETDPDSFSDAEIVDVEHAFSRSDRMDNALGIWVATN
ncbi:hypothetical protein GCM10009583_16740 [Ornithinicoccus hortensis]|uniref:Uncharacterized protein n=1 Tax=Ornithinicoccus hortensis TaxID=82346 RepID=A0A542YNM6_9MICO|nr:hypothetical protein FB467_0745 [Ornithinicoccus hortensis]